MTGPSSPLITSSVPPAIYFLSDYGTSDEFVGVVRAVLHRDAPGVPVIDLTHQVPPFDVTAGAAALVRSAPYLGPGAVLAVVDPGVGTSRLGVAIRVAGRVADRGSGGGAGKGDLGPEWWVGPDNGLLLPAVEGLGGPAAVYALATEAGSTFDGRDVFAPAVAYLVGGGDPSSLGAQVDPESLVGAPDLPPDHFDGAILVTSVTHIDAFGNIQLRARPAALDQLGVIADSVMEVELVPSRTVTLTARRVAAFGDLGRGEFGVLLDSDNHLALVLDRASAAAQLRLHTTGIQVRIWHLG